MVIFPFTPRFLLTGRYPMVTLFRLIKVLAMTIKNRSTIFHYQDHGHVRWGGWREKTTAGESKTLQARMIDIITGTELIRLSYLHSYCLPRLNGVLVCIACAGVVWEKFNYR